ncbi:hypothetical protein ACQ856_30335 (plasmid) [Mycolicibacterium psychrotolerans]|uniref:hypothetical protein n=1 Tax=Mycolicibacterium psychrotolerans TaxID=216929 RepID=UPI003D66C094
MQHRPHAGRPPTDGRQPTAWEADHQQAGSLRSELHHQTDLLAERVAKYRSALETYRRRNEHHQARRMERQLRLASREHVQLCDMIHALDQRFPRAD